MFRYEDLVLRNAGYIQPELQEKMRRTRLLFAGCGVGSVAAEQAMRLGFENFRLVDGDRIETHNLNRQAYVASDVGDWKVNALARRLLAVNPQAKVETFPTWLNNDNVGELAAGCDMVFDTIDFLDLPAILALHTKAAEFRIPVISAWAAGWGGAVIVFVPGGTTLAEFLGASGGACQEEASYVRSFQTSFTKIASRFPPEVATVMTRALTAMADKKPCPAPQLCAGASCAASMMVTIAARILENLPVKTAPDIAIVNLGEHV